MGSITNTTTLKTAVLRWMQRPDDELLDASFDDFLELAERRMYYGYATEEMSNPLRSDPLRIPEMEAVDSAFTFTSGTKAQPTGFLELISAYNSTSSYPMQIVAQAHLDGYGTQTLNGTKLIAVSGTNFRVLDAPSSVTATLRYYKKLTTPTTSTSNDIMDNYPDVYLFACLIEANIFAHFSSKALEHLQTYNASVAGLNARRQRITASSAPRIRLRAGMTP